MLDSLKTAIRNKCRLSDKQLHVATKLARAAELWCSSGVLFWGGAVVLGLVALGLQAVGVGIPAAVGMSSLIFGTFMAAKSVALRHGFRFLHKKGLAVQEKRGIKARAASATKFPLSLSAVSKVAPMCAAFNTKARERILEVLASLPHPTPKNGKARAAGPGVRL